MNAEYEALSSSPFGTGIGPVRDAGKADWIVAECTGRLGTVGAIVPHRFEAVLCVSPPPPAGEDWWYAYRDLFVEVCGAASHRFEMTDSLYLAVWDGHFDRSFILNASHRSIDSRVLFPTFTLGYRTYYVLKATVDDLGGMQYPGFDGWRNPDLVWPSSRQWYIATDVDYWSLYVASDRQLLTALKDSLPTRTQLVGLEAATSPES